MIPFPENFLPSSPEQRLQLVEWQRKIREAALEEAAALISTGDFCREVDHVQGFCDCQEMASAIRQAKAP